MGEAGALAPLPDATRCPCCGRDGVSPAGGEFAGYGRCRCGLVVKWGGWVGWRMLSDREWDEAPEMLAALRPWAMAGRGFQ